MNVLEFANSRLWERQMESDASSRDNVGSSYNPLARLTSSLIQPDAYSPAGQSAAGSAADVSSASSTGSSTGSSSSSAPKLPTPHPCPHCEGILYYSFDPSGRPKKCMSCAPPQRLGYEQWIIAVDEGGEWICVPHWVSARRHFLMSRVDAGELSLDSPPRWLDADDFALACGGWKVSEKKLEWGRAWRDKAALLKWCRTIGVEVDDAVVGLNWAKDSVRVGGGGSVGGSAGSIGGVDSSKLIASADSREGSNVVVGIASSFAKPTEKPSGGKSKSGKKTKGKSSGKSLPAGPSLFGNDDLMGDEHL